VSLIDEVSPTNQTFQFRDGRTLGYAEYGAADGTPVFYFHGYVGARLEGGAWANAATQAGVRLIALDRPGFGLSTFQPGRHFLDWPTDVVELADHLSLPRFAVMGTSGGGPYALACAYKIPERLTACGVICGMEPMELGVDGMSRGNRLIFSIARRFPWLLKTILWSTTGKMSQDEVKFKAAMEKSLKAAPEPDRLALQNSDIGSYLIASTKAGFCQGAEAAALEGRLYASPWGFRLEEVAFNPIYLWHGEKDVNVPIGMARAAASQLAHCQASFYPDEAHLSLPVNHAEEILRLIAH
jgi:pimeloyl-ACP methyl ester carboxylesterase